MIRTALRRNANRVQTAQTRSLPAPTGGWNAIDPLAKMPPEDAVILRNWIPHPGYVELRPGSRLWSSGAPAAVESLLVYRGTASGADEVYSVSDGDVYDTTVMDTTFSAPVKTGLTNSRVQSLNFANDGGRWLICCNGEDTPFYYDGSTWGNLTITGSSGSITLDPTTLVDVLMFKRRLWFIEKDSTHVWYLPTDAIQGAANLLDLGPILQDGGFVQCMGTWSLDGGQGQDDYLVLMSNQGEIAVYQGTDPDNPPIDWAIVGVFEVGEPLGRRSLFKFGGDLNALTTVGVLPLSQALRRDRAQDDDVTITAKIQNAFHIATQAYKNNFGWEALTYPKGSLAIYNIPVVELTTSYQYVQNLQTGAWCEFRGLNAFCWALANDQIYFGSTDGLYEWDVGVTDAGVDVEADLKTAFNTFGNSGRIKHFTMLQPILNATANVTPAIELLIDFEERDPTAVPTTIVDRTTTLQIRKDWTSVNGVGVYGSVRMQVILSEDPDLVSTLVDGAGSDIVTGDGFTVATDSGEPVYAQVQCIAFNAVYEPGGIL